MLLRFIVVPALAVMLSTAPLVALADTPEQLAGQSGMEIAFAETLKKPNAAAIVKTHMALLLAHAKAGEPYAQRTLGEVYMNPDYPHIKQNPGAAQFWLTKAAEQGNLNAAKRLADLYNGDAGDRYKNPDKAFHLYMQSAMDGDHSAQYHVGYYYYKGMGVKRDVDKGFLYMQQAAIGGHEGAQGALALMYGGGMGTARDPVQAIKWGTIESMNKGADGKIVAEIERRYPAQVEEGRSLGMAWWMAHLHDNDPKQLALRN